MAHRAEWLAIADQALRRLHVEWAVHAAGQHLAGQPTGTQGRLYGAHVTILARVGAAITASVSVGFGKS